MIHEKFREWLKENWTRHIPWVKCRTLVRDYFDSKNECYPTDMKGYGSNCSQYFTILRNKGYIKRYNVKTWMVTDVYLESVEKQHFLKDH